MPEQFRALLVVLFLAAGVFAFAVAPACTTITATENFKNRRNLWFGVTLAAFLGHDFWIFIIAAAILLFFANQKESNKLAMYCFVLFAVPLLQAKISGLGVLNHLATVNYGRLLGLVILLPAFFSLYKDKDAERLGRSIPDLFIVGYLAVQFFLQVRYSTTTNAIRIGIVYAFVDDFLPYYVASRSLRNLPGFRDVLMAFVAAVMVLSILGGFEATRHWLLYASLQRALDVPGVGLGFYLERGQGSGLLRAQTTVDSIPLGYVVAIAIMFFLYLRNFVGNQTVWRLGLALLVLGLVSALSRGPWVGMAAMGLVFIATSPFRGKLLARIGVIGIVVIPLLLITPYGETVINYLPFVGTVESENVDFRKRLIEISIGVMLENPYFGAADYLNSPAMQELYQGGMIDVVNSYIGVGLSSGFVGLSFFVGFFLTALGCVYGRMRKLQDRNSELYLLGQVLLAVLVGIMVIIGTVSSITFVPIVYWMVGGLAVAYTRLPESAITSDATPDTDARKPLQAAAMRH